MIFPTVWTVLDTVDALSGRRNSKSGARSGAQAEAEAAFDNLVGRFDVQERMPSRELTVTNEADAEQLISLGADFDEETETWFVPDSIPSDRLTAFENWWPLVPDDLRDREARMIRTKDGKAIEGYILPQDKTTGGDSLATPILYAAFPVLSALTFLLFLIHPFLGLLSILLIIPFLVALCQGEGASEGIWSLVKFYISPLMFASVVGMGALAKVSAMATSLVAMVPFVGSMFGMLLGASGSNVIGQLVASIALTIPLTIIIFVSKLLLKSDNEDDSVVVGGFFEQVKHALKWAFVAALIIGVAAALPWGMGAIAGFLLACFAPMNYSERDFIARNTELEIQGAAHGGLAAADNIGKITRGVREQQSASAIADTTPVITLGIATGNMSKVHYAYAPDRSSPMKLSCRDFSMHFLGFGKTGGGKTSNMARNIALQYRASGYGGAIVRDGKGSLAGELRQIIDLMIEPGVSLALLEGLTAKEVTIAFNSLADRRSASSLNWELGADEIIDHATTILEALHLHEGPYKQLATRMARNYENQLTYMRMEIVKLEKMNRDITEAKKSYLALHENHQNWVKIRDRDRKWLWNVQTLLVVIDAMSDCRTVNGVPSVGPAMAQMAAELGFNAKEARIKAAPESISPLLQSHSQLDGSLTRVFSASWTAMAHETRQSYMGNVMKRIMPLVRGGDLKDANGTPWYVLEKGADVECALRGKFVGINLPTIDHGVAADAVQALIRQRIYTNVKKRAKYGNKWRVQFPDQKPVMDVCDEAQLVVGKDEAEMAPISRSLGLMMTMFTQGYESLAAKFNDHDTTIQFCNTFQNIACLEASPETYAYLMKRFGKARKLKRDMGGQGLNFERGIRDWRNDPINDLHHPGRAVMRKMARSGAGKITSIAPTEGDADREGWQGHRTRRLKDRRIVKATVVRKGAEFVEEPLFSETTYNEELKQQGMAILFLNRAGAPRADTASLNYVSDATLDYVESNHDEAMRVIKQASEMGLRIEDAVREYKRQTA